MQGKYYWDGEPVTIEHIAVLVKANEEQNLYWYNHKCMNHRVDGLTVDEDIFHALEITKEGRKFIICNEFGLGINKCRKGGTWRQAHQSFRKEDILEVYREDEPRFLGKNVQFSEKQYLENEEIVRAWQRHYYPEEFNKMEALRKASIQYT